MSTYSRSITRFSADGRLGQIDNALEAVKRGKTVVAAKCKGFIMVAVERLSVAKLQNPSTFHKIVELDSHVICAFAGFHPDGRALVSKAQLQCQQYRLQNEDPLSIEGVAKYIASVKNKNTTRSGTRPYGTSTLVCGFDKGEPRIFETLPNGIYLEWKAKAIGHSDQTVFSYLEKHYKDDMTSDELSKLTISALLEVVEHGSKNLEVAIMTPDAGVKFLSEDELAEIIKSIEATKK